MATATFTIEGDVNVQITITENANGTLTFDLTVLDTTGSIGDLNAIYFDLADDSITNSLSVDGEDVSGTAFKVDGVTKVSNYTNMNGSELKSLDDKFDVGIQFGSQGISEDDIQSTSFTLAGPEGTVLTLADFSLQDFGVRLTSVGEEGGSREDSLKLVGTSDEYIDPPLVDPDDSFCVTEDKVFGSETDADSFILLANDTGASAITSVTNSNGQTFDITQPDTLVINGDGTQLLVSPDGSFSFAVQSPFIGGGDPYGYLNDGETAATSFTYTTDNGITATIDICIEGVTDGPIDPNDGGIIGGDGGGFNPDDGF